jgi:hypothetical protein
VAGRVAPSTSAASWQTPASASTATPARAPNDLVLNDVVLNDVVLDDLVLNDLSQNRPGQNRLTRGERIRDVSPAVSNGPKVRPARTTPYGSTATSSRVSKGVLGMALATKSDRSRRPRGPQAPAERSS